MVILKKWLILCAAVCHLAADQQYIDSNYFLQGINYAVSWDGNSLYIADANQKVFRFNFTDILGNPSAIHSTTHTGTITMMALSRGETFLATGSKDYTIEVIESFSGKKMCKFTHYNQIRAMVFDPNSEEVLYAAAVDDLIRKWNITGCSLVAEKSVGQSISSMAINPNGSHIAYGTINGNVGIINTALTSFSTNTAAHEFTVLKVAYTNNDNYVSFGQDSVVILWSNGAKVSTFTSVTSTPILNCDLFIRNDYRDQFTLAGCIDQAKSFRTIRITNTTVTLISSHGSNRNFQFAVFKYVGHAEQHFMMNSGSVITHNAIFDSQTSNTACTPHFGLSTVQNACRFCFFMIDGCHFCDDEKTCTSCAIGYYAKAGLCSKCPQECATCSNANVCGICAVGYEEQGSSNKCIPKTVAEKGCYTYTGPGKCSIAANQHYLNGVNVRSCAVTHAACLECQQNNGNCITCSTGYYVNGSTCSACSAFIPTCLACSNKTVCLHCPVAHKISGSGVLCAACDPTCQTCSYYYNDCLTCDAAQNRQLVNLSCPCLAGYYQNLPSYTCALCLAVLTNCHRCSDNKTCTECKPFFYFVTTAGVNQCELCSKYCQTCSVTSTNCSSCNSVAYHRVRSGTSCVCQAGYVSLSSSVPCIGCSILNIGCTLCSNETYCTSCGAGYYLQNYNTSTRLCTKCPYYCPDCTASPAAALCNSCVIGTHRTLLNNSCNCNSGYFDDNQTAICQKCSDIIPNCSICTNRTKCITCNPGLLTDASSSSCAPCIPTCLTCGSYYNLCTSCDPAHNRVIVNNTCACQPQTYEQDNVCRTCRSAIANCNSCESQHSCTGCELGYTLQDDLKACIDCAAEMNGCTTCKSKAICVACRSPFMLIRNRCRCPLDEYTSKKKWGTCNSYKIPELSSSLGVELQVHQHQNNSFIVFIRFHAKVLYVLNSKIEDSISLKINNKPHAAIFDSIDSNRVRIRAQLSSPLSKPNVTVTFALDVFYNQHLLTLYQHEYTVTPSRLYFYTDEQITAQGNLEKVCSVAMHCLKWAFLVFSILGYGHLIFPFMFFLQLMPAFLMFNISLPACLSAVLEGFLVLQVPSITPLLNLRPTFSIIFPPMTFDYYHLGDYFLFAKISDLLVLLFINFLTKFDHGLLRMFPSGKIRRYLYEALVRRGYAVMSICILTLQTSLLMMAGGYITHAVWESKGEIFNYCCCVLAFGFYLVYNFNLASNLQETKRIKNIENENCFLGLNSQQPTASKAVLVILFSNFWLAASLCLVTPMAYFVSSLLVLIIRFAIQMRPNCHLGKIQHIHKLLQSLLILTIYCIMFVFYLSENTISLTHQASQRLGISTTALVLFYLIVCLSQKIVYGLGVEGNQIQKLTQNKSDVIFVHKIEQNQEQEEYAEINDDQVLNSNVKEFFGNKGNKENSGKSMGMRSAYMKHAALRQSLNIDESKANKFMRNRSEAIHDISLLQESQANHIEKEKEKRTKAHPSKYAQNSLQLRYHSQQIQSKQTSELHE